MGVQRYECAHNESMKMWGVEKVVAIADIPLACIHLLLATPFALGAMAFVRIINKLRKIGMYKAAK